MSELTLQDEWDSDKHSMLKSFLCNMDKNDNGNPPINKTITELPVGSEVVIEDKNEDE